MSGSIDYTCFHLVVHIFLRTWTLFLHFVGTFILRAAPETVVIFRTQIQQNAVQAFRGLVTSDQPIRMPREKKKGGVRGGRVRRSPADGRMLTLRHKNSASSSINLRVSVMCDSLF